MRRSLERLTEQLEPVATYIRRFNQIVLCFPVWLVIGFSSILRSSNVNTGWQESVQGYNPEKMY